MLIYILFDFIDFNQELFSADIRVEEMHFELGIKVLPSFLVYWASKKFNLAFVVLNELTPLRFFDVNNFVNLETIDHVFLGILHSHFDRTRTKRSISVSSICLRLLSLTFERTDPRILHETSAFSLFFRDCIREYITAKQVNHHHLLLWSTRWRLYVVSPRVTSLWLLDTSHILSAIFYQTNWCLRLVRDL